MNPEARFRLDTITPINLQGASGYSLALAGGELTSPIVYGQLSSAIVDDALLTVPVTTRFGLSFVAKPNHGDIFAFGSYRISYDGSVHIRFIDEDSEVTELASMPLTDDKVSRYSFAFDGVALSVRVDQSEFSVDAPAEEQVTTFEILAAGGILDSVYYWSSPISSEDHRSILPTVPFLHQSDYLVDLRTEESYMTPNVQYLTTGQQGSFDAEAAGWVSYFGSDSRLIANEAVYKSGELITEVPDTVDVVGEVEITEFLDASIEVHPLFNIVTRGFGTGDYVHPVWRSSHIGTRGGVTLEPKENFDSLDNPLVVSTVSFWMDPFEGEIMPGVTMTGGVVTGAAFINGLSYSGAVLKDRFMITINQTFDDLFVINPDISNLYANTAPASQVESRALYESFFIPLTISVPSDTITVGSDSTFVIDASWGIVTSG